MKKIMLLLVVLIGLLGASACNTARGVGEDIEEVGDAVKDAVD